IERHQGRIVYLTYEPSGPVKTTLYLVGKGVTYDTGGADIKAGGVMAGMSRDKCGAAAVAGFMQVLTLLKPKDIKVVAGLPLVRNSVGEDSYVADEVIISRNKLRVRIGNTDAEGRMIMGDVLCKARESAVNAVNPRLITIATLTGHAVLTVGPGYSVVMDNGPARKSAHAQQLQAAGEEVGDMIEISTIRKEDVAFHKGKLKLIIYGISH
ncbi:putative aminopeptidase W07G4.4, partial [Blattella germanica]